MDKISASVKLIALQHVPVAADDLYTLRTQASACAAAELADIAKHVQHLNFGEPTPRQGSGDVQRADVERLVARCEQLAYTCQEAKAHASGSGWDSPAWQECKIFAHLCAPMGSFGAAALLVCDSTCDAPVSHGDVPLTSQAIHQVDLALMTGCPYQLAEPVLTYACKQMFQQEPPMSDLPSAEVHATACSRIVSEMKAICDDVPITRVHISEIGDFRKEFWKQDRPVIISGATCDWPALEKWKHMHWWKTMHGHRTVPLEVGRYASPHWHEALSTISSFIDSYMTPSIERDLAAAKGCQNRITPEVTQMAMPAADAAQACSTTCAVPGQADATGAEPGVKENVAVAYIAQHRIFDQIPQLLEDVPEPGLWANGYEVMNMWMGTQGTVRSRGM